jgi:hypothetical protein
MILAMKTKLMLTITREDNEIHIVIDTNVGWTITAKHARNTKLDAILLYRHLHSCYYDRIERIRREAYNKGWSDKQKRHIKQAWFSGDINSSI